MAGKSYLMVEGESDRSFFEEFCKRNNLSGVLTVLPPKGLGGVHNSKQGVFNTLPMYLSQLADGRCDGLAIVVDADQSANGHGAQKTCENVLNIVRHHGYEPPVTLDNGGYVFKHNDGLPDFGLWIMPDGQSDGILESWLGRCISENQTDLYESAVDTVSGIDRKLFGAARQPKAEIATWLAWQNKPGESLYYCLAGDLLNPSAPLYIGLKEWLSYLFLEAE